MTRTTVARKHAWFYEFKITKTQN